MNEDDFVQQDPKLTVMEIATAKARAVHLEKGDIAVGADTLVVLGESVLGKPASVDEARARLAQLRGKSHTVLTGVLLRRADGAEWLRAVTTTVRMREFSDVEVEDYIARGEPFDKAGGYGVQDARFNPVDQMQGCWLNVVGLPLCDVSRDLEALGGPPALVDPKAPAPCLLCERGLAATRVA